MPQMSQMPQMQQMPKQVKQKIDPYKVLNIGKNYDESSLKKAYLKKSIRIASR